ncbi:MAG TPA: TIGR03667 family PPOX class F420-dependent oxidoreductase [Pseudonocardiaceae bacterium]|jgi:PPOX class probable F420-dependent enzyme
MAERTTPFSADARMRLTTEKIIWLTTVSQDGTPQPNPVWFLYDFDNDSVLIYNRPAAHRLNHIRHRPRLSLNLNSNAGGGGILVITGDAARVEDVPTPHENPDYLAKYEADMARVSGSPANFGASYPVAVRIQVTSVRGF